MYSYTDGDFIIIGPECFTDLGQGVISWRGENFYRPGCEPHENWLRRLVTRLRRD